MGIITFLKGLFGLGVTVVEKPAAGTEIYQENQPKSGEIHITSVWDILKFTEHTQAFHLVSVIRFDEWVTMDEIRRRIFELFQVDYQNERSLYPYLKTLVDIGLIETTNIGGKRKWRKKDLLIKTEQAVAAKEEIKASEGVTV